MVRELGKVRWFNNTKGYGFIELPGGKDLFFHYSNIEGKGFKTVNEDEMVEYEIRQTPRGPEADKILREKDQLLWTSENRIALAAEDVET
jgi:CspA family cold shock protein